MPVLLETPLLVLWPRWSRIVLPTLGLGDLTNRVSRQEALADLSAIVALIHRQGDSSFSRESVCLFRAGATERHRKRFPGRGGCVLIPNILDGLLGDRKRTSDLFHPNDAGYEILAERFFDAIKPCL